MIAKLDGTFRQPAASSAAQVEVTSLQQSIFNAPVPGSTATGTAPAASQGQGLPSKPPARADQANADDGTAENRGTKRPREDEDEEGSDGSDSDVAMEEDSDDE